MSVSAEARALYEARKACREHPAGKFDNAGRWRPSEQEECECCRYVRSPSRAWPYSYMVHCRTLRHCQQLLAKRGVSNAS